MVAMLSLLLGDSQQQAEWRTTLPVVARVRMISNAASTPKTEFGGEGGIRTLEGIAPLAV